MSHYRNWGESQETRASLFWAQVTVPKEALCWPVVSHTYLHLASSSFEISKLQMHDRCWLSQGGSFPRSTFSSFSGHLALLLPQPRPMLIWPGEKEEIFFGHCVCVWWDTFQTNQFPDPAVHMAAWVPALDNGRQQGWVQGWLSQWRLSQGQLSFRLV